MNLKKMNLLSQFSIAKFHKVGFVSKELTLTLKKIRLNPLF